MAVPPRVVEVASVVRREVERWVRATKVKRGPNDVIDPKTLCGACAIGSYALWCCLRQLKYRSTFVCHFDERSKGGHCWVEVRGHVVDITATQFDGPQVAVFEIGTTPEWLEFQTIHYYPGRRYENRSAVDVVRDWHSESPLGYEDYIENLVRKCTRTGDLREQYE